MSARADAFVFWTDSANDSIGQASIDGTGVNDSFIENVPGVCGVTTDILNLYWGNARLGTVGTVQQDGENPNPSLLSGGNGTCGVSDSGTTLAWANFGNSTIGIGSTNGTFVSQSWAFPPNVVGPLSTASYFNGSNDVIYWLNGDGSLWRTFGDAQSFQQILPPNTVEGPGIAVSATDGLFWINEDAGSIGHANLDGSGVSTLLSGIFGAQCGIAVDDTYVYWTNSSNGTIGRALLNGSSPEPDFIDLGVNSYPCWIAVDADTPAASFSPASLNFGDVLVGSGPTASLDVTVTNSASTSQPLIGDSTELAGPDAGDFSITGDDCTLHDINPGDGCTVSVDFSPSSLGGKTASLFIQTDDPDGTLIVPLSGSGTDPDQSVAPTAIPFGHQLVGTSGPVFSAVLTNGSGASAPDDVGQAALTGPGASQFTIVTDECSNTTLAIGASCEVSLRFAPTAEGSATASLSIPSDDPTSPATVALSGTGTAPDEVVSPTSLAFGPQEVGTDSATQTIDVDNSVNGTGPLVLGSVALAGANPSQFQLVFDNCSGQSISPGDDCKVGVRFAPSAAGSQAATVQIPSNGSSSPVAVSVTGSGQAAPAPPVQNARCAKLRAKLKKAKSKKQRKALRKKLRKRGC